jgi:hypothetical protein
VSIKNAFTKYFVFKNVAQLCYFNDEHITQTTTTNSKMEQEAIKFISSDGKIYSLEPQFLNCSEVLKAQVRNADKMSQETVDGAYKLNRTARELDVLFTYLSTGEVIDTFDESSVDLFDEYLVQMGEKARHYPVEFLRIQLQENWYREFTKDNPKCKHYELNDVIESIPKFSTVNEINAFHSKTRIFELNHGICTTKNQRLRVCGIDLADFNGKLVLAGGSLISMLLNQSINDYDFFFCSVDQEEAFEIIERIKKSFFIRGYTVRIVGSKNCWTLRIGAKKQEKKIQFIFRNYKNYEEIMLGFDVDVCSIVYDGISVKLSERCKYALTHHVNTVDLSRRSPTYEVRLAKYYFRGFDIFVPNFDYDRLKKNPSENFPKHPKLLMGRTSGILTLNSKHFSTHNNRLGNMILPMPRPMRFSRYMARNRKVNKSSTLSKVNDNADVSHPYYKYTTARQNEPYNIMGGYRSGVQLVGLDIIKYLTSFAEMPNVQISDYSHEPNKLDRHITLDDTSYGCRITTRPGKYMDFTAVEADMDSEALSADLNYYDLVPEWIVQNPGRQISSSIHSLIMEDSNCWYDGYYYSNPERKSKPIVIVPVKEEKITFIDF